MLVIGLNKNIQCRIQLLVVLLVVLFQVCIGFILSQQHVSTATATTTSSTRPALLLQQQQSKRLTIRSTTGSNNKLLSSINCSCNKNSNIKCLPLSIRRKRRTTTMLYLFGRRQKQQDTSGNKNNSDGTNNSSSSIVVLEINAESIKIGPLRFLLNMHLVGEQNNPKPQSWLVRQTDNNNEIQVYYHDGSAMIQITLLYNKITIQRFGSNPSLQYQLQEAVLIHNILDELEIVAYGIPTSDSVNDNTTIEITNDQRLLRLLDISILEKARATLPVQRAQS
jgi:hypothetical protein